MADEGNGVGDVIKVVNLLIKVGEIVTIIPAAVKIFEILFGNQENN